MRSETFRFGYFFQIIDCLLLYLDRASMRLAYQDLSVQEKKQNEKLKRMDPKKAQQAERLGMGFAGSR